MFLLSAYVCSHRNPWNSNIEKVSYQKNYKNDYIDYKLELKKKIAGQYRKIPYGLESTGTINTIELFGYLLSACSGKTVILDESDEGIHDILYKKIITDLQKYINGVLIITTHNTMLLEDNSFKSATYVVRETPSGSNEIINITKCKTRTYVDSNIRQKYLGGDYEGIPTIADLCFADFLSILEN